MGNSKSRCNANSGGYRTSRWAFGEAPKVLDSTGDVIGTIGESSGMVGANGQPVFTIKVIDIRPEVHLPDSNRRRDVHRR